MLPVPKPIKAPNIKRVSIMNWLKGYESVLDPDRKDNSGLKVSANAILQQNGTLEPRPSLCRYGTQPPGTVLGTVFSFVDATGGSPVNKMICVCNVSGTASVYINQDGGAWTQCTGKSYNTSAPCHFEQIANTILVMNGTDNLSYLTVGTTTITPFASLSVPTISSVAASSSLTSGSPTTVVYYRVSAANQGETPGSADVTATVNAPRSDWNTNGRSGDQCTIAWARITGATIYNIYIGDESGFEYYLDTVADPGSGSMTYIDNNSLVANTNRLAPNGDSTAGPRVTRATNVLGQVYMYGDADNPYRVWFGGTQNSALDFSAFDGGGFIDIDKGGKDFPAHIHGFRDGHGNPVATCFMQGQSGRGKIVHLAYTTTTIGNNVLNYVATQEGNGQDGTSSPDGVIYAADALFYPSRDAFKKTGTNPDMQNILSTTNISDLIFNDVLGLNVATMETACGIEYQGRLYWSLPVGSSTNNQMWIYDLNRGGVWTNPWFVSIAWLWLYDDSSGFTHFMALGTNGVIYEFSYNQLTTDDTTPFMVDLASGLVKFAPDGIEWWNVIDITFVFEQLQGTVNLSVSGRTLDSSLQNLGMASNTPNTNVVGWNEASWDDPLRYWDAVVTTPIFTGADRTEVTIEIDDQMPWLEWEVSSNTGGVDFQLADVIVRGVDIGVIGLSDS